jgi:hypothetical protein
VVGIVRTQAQTTLATTPQRTAVRRLIEPTPMMAPVIVCVVLTGIPPKMTHIKVNAAPVSAQNPSIGRR